MWQGLLDDWQNKVSGQTEESLNSKSKNPKTQDVKAIDNQIDALEGLSAAEEICKDSKLKPNIENLKTQVATEINTTIANYQEQRN